MRLGILFLTLIASMRADEGCPDVSFLSARSAVLVPSSSTHRVLLRQGKTYTAYEQENKSPYKIVRTIPHFEKELSACSSVESGLNYQGVISAGQTPSGGFIFDMVSDSATGTESIAEFDAGLNFVSAAPAPFTAMAFADLNGDGHIDLIGVVIPFDRALDSPKLEIALGTGGVNFQTPLTYPIVLDDILSTYSVAIADVNQDHKPDILLLSTSTNGGKITVYLGNGDGTVQAARIVTSSSAGPFGAMAVADLNGDGKPDLVFTSQDVDKGQMSVNVALGGGDGTFAAPVSFGAAGMTAVTIGDLNGDGIPDIVTSGVTILFGDGKGGFPSRRDVLVEDQGNLIVTDFDGDGLADVVFAQGNPAIMLGVSVLPGRGSGRFAGPPLTAIPNYSSTDNSIVTLATADINGDAIADVVSTEAQGQVSVLKGIGDGTFQSTFQFKFASGLPYSATFADFNHDGKLDLVVAGSGYSASSRGEVDVLFGNGDGTFSSQSPSQLPWGRSPSRLPISTETEMWTWRFLCPRRALESRTKFRYCSAKATALFPEEPNMLLDPTLIRLLRATSIATVNWIL